MNICEHLDTYSPMKLFFTWVALRINKIVTSGVVKIRGVQVNKGVLLGVHCKLEEFMNRAGKAALLVTFDETSQ